MAMAATKEYVDRRIAELSVVLSSELRASKDAIGPFLIRAVKFFHHPVLGDLRLNFCDHRGDPVDTVILAGENGSGKSTVLNAINDALISIERSTCKNDLELEIQAQSGIYFLKFEKNNSIRPVCLDANHIKTSYDRQLHRLQHTIFSDVGIDYQGESIKSVTSKDLDTSKEYMRSGKKLATQIKQLIVDIQALDDEETALAVRDARGKGISVDALPSQTRIKRLTDAFSCIFHNLQYDRIENKGEYKQILFKNNGTDVTIDSLSSGEKQIVYRGCFVLQNLNALKGAQVFIDEPELSMHPEWQKKILDFYKRMFINEKGIQTSQIFIATHSPFIIHNDLRHNDKVLILKRDDAGKIVVSDRPEYYCCDSIEAVRDAFSLSVFVDNRPVVYVEGRTDADYFNRAIEAYGLNVPFRYQSIGRVDEQGNDVDGGDGALKRAASFLGVHNPPSKVVIQYDCDKKHPDKCIGNVLVRSVTQYENSKGCKIGVENALVLEHLKGRSWEEFLEARPTEGKFGKPGCTYDLRKMELCKYICALPNEDAKPILANLKLEVERIATWVASMG